MKTILEFFGFCFIFLASILGNIGRIFFRGTQEELIQIAMSIESIVHPFFCPFINHGHNNEKEE